MNVKRGFRFIHSSWLDDKYKPAEFVVTRVARGVVYYRATDADGRPSGMAFKTSVEDFPKRVKNRI